MSCCISNGGKIKIRLIDYLFQQAQAEQEEEFISNTLLKKIQTLKKEKEVLAMNYEQEEEFLTNDLSRKLMRVRSLPTGLCGMKMFPVVILAQYHSSARSAVS